MEHGTICVLSGPLSRYATFSASLAQLHRPEGTIVDYVIGHGIVNGLNLSTAHFLETDGAWFWVMGDDHTFGPDALNRLITRNVPIVGPLNVQREKPFAPILYASNSPDTPAIHQWSWRHLDGKSGLIKLTPREACGNAGMLIRREVFEKLPTGKWWQDRPGQSHSEDIYFCERAHALGYDIYIDLDVRMGHSFHGDAIPVQNDRGEWLVGLQVSRKTIAYLRVQGE